MENILKYAARLSKYASKLSPHSPVEVLFLQFPRTVKAVEGFNLTLPDGVKWFPLQSYRQFLELQYNSVCVVSDSGTAQEETCLLGIPTIVPRDFTERPQSVNSLCSVMLNVNSAYNISWDYSFTYIKKINESIEVMDTAWLGEGDTSSTIVDLIETIAF